MKHDGYILTQDGCTSRETRIAAMQAIVQGIGRQQWSVGRPWPETPAGFLPVGSVEFIQAVMARHGYPCPPEIGFPGAIEPWLKRRVRASRAGLLGLDGPVFVKPRKTIKTFTGFVYDSDPAAESGQDEFTVEQLDVFLALPADAPVWISEVVTWQSEWRYYVLRGEVIGAGRYDADGEEDAAKPVEADVLDAVAAFEASGAAPAGYAMDFGVLDSGETALVEINDGWALGYYTGTLEAAAYLDLLAARWKEIATQQDAMKMPIKIQDCRNFNPKAVSIANHLGSDRVEDYRVVEAWLKKRVTTLMSTRWLSYLTWKLAKQV